MKYNEALDFIHSRRKFGTKPGMERIKALCDAFDNPQDKLKFVHVAGTNGKGSTCNMISEILQCAKYKVGLFTSPYIIDFKERLQINSAMITESKLAELTEKVKPVVEKLDKNGIEATEFEIITLIAFLYFLEENCDIVVLEVGLGGTLDSTNIIKKSEVSVITSISMDHMDVLGDTILDIAEHKCGIIKEGCPVVIYPQPDFTVERFIKEKAKEKGSESYTSELSRLRLITEDIDGMDVVYSAFKVRIPLTGKHQIYNFATALAAINVLKNNGWNIEPSAMLNGIANVKMPARCEVINKSPLTIIDGGHNAEGIDALYYCLQKYCKNKDIYAVFGMMKDKDYEYAVSKIAPICKKIYAVTPENPRSLPSKELAKVIKKYCKKVKAVDIPAKAFEKVCKKANENDVILVSGSLYLASEIKNLQN